MRFTDKAETFAERIPKKTFITVLVTSFAAFIFSTYIWEFSIETQAIQPRY